jgi:Fe-S-cluster containining protein
MKTKTVISIIKDCCSKNCFGFENNHASCCSIEDRDFIIGPITDADRFLVSLRERFNDDDIQFQDVFITYEEGQKFSEKSTWQNPNNYPCLRINTETSRKYCIFYNPFVKACSVYSIRPSTCVNYRCDFLKKQLETVNE